MRHDCKVILCVILLCGMGCSQGWPWQIKVIMLKDDIPQRCIDMSVTEVSCAGASSPDALLPHPDDCQLFYYCVTPAAPPVCRACPAGLHFSPTEHVCDQPEHAGCLLSTTDTPHSTTEPPTMVPST